MKYDRSNDPNAGRLVESLRHLGYGNYEAIADIVDNSIDAEATKIDISLSQKSGNFELSISDNGSGMDQRCLDQAMRLGSITERNQNSDLGRFGMGLVTASLSLAQHCYVISRGSDGVWSSAWDVEEIKEKNAFCKHFDAATESEVTMLDRRVGKDNTGTLIMLSKIDNIRNKNTSSFASILRNHLARVHRQFIEAGLSITVNDEKLKPIDPLQLNEPETEVVIDEQIPVNLDENGRTFTENVRVRIVLVPEEPVHETSISRSMRAQGFYIMRNQREVMDAVTLNFFTKHNDFNRMRAEIYFPGTMDNAVGIEFTKRQVNLTQSLQDQLSSVLTPTCRTIKRREATKRRVATSPIQQELHAQSAKVISEKDKLLIKPKAKIEKRSSPSGSGQTDRHTPEETQNERKNLKRTQALESRLGCEIREERLGPNGQVFESDMEGRKIILRYNVEHPFYQRFVIENLDDPKIVNAVDFLIYSMASAEQKMLDEGANEVVNNFKAVFSANLRTLLN